MRDHTAADALRVVLYSHDSVGLGHIRRNLAIAEALAAGLPEYTGRPVSGLLISGASDAAQFPLPDGWDWLLVPGITKRSQTSQKNPDAEAGSGPEPSARPYVPRRLDVDPQRVIGLRSSVITGALLSFSPHLLIVDRHPFGADGELDEPLEAFRQSAPEARIVLGLREVLDDPKTAAAEWEAVGTDRVAELYDELWVYGDRSVHDTVATGEIPAQLVSKTRFTGLLASDRQVRATVDLPEDPFVVTMVGGGADGVALARTAAAAPLPDGVTHLVVTGPQMPAADRMAVHSAAVVAGTGARVVSSVPDGLACVQQAKAIIAMGGYNTVSEALSTETPVLVFPRVEPRTEQLIRARDLGAQGSIDWLLPCRLSPQRLGRWIAGAVADHSRTGARQVAARQALRLNGLSRVVEFAAGLAALAPNAAGPPPVHETQDVQDTRETPETSETRETYKPREKRSFGREIAHVG